MNPTQKAKEIIAKVFEAQHVDDRAKMICLSSTKIALICVDEIIKTQRANCGECGGGEREYWTEVKKEIQKIDAK